MANWGEMNNARTQNAIAANQSAADMHTKSTKNLSDILQFLKQKQAEKEAQSANQRHDVGMQNLLHGSGYDAGVNSYQTPPELATGLQGILQSLGMGQNNPATPVQSQVVSPTYAATANPTSMPDYSNPSVTPENKPIIPSLAAPTQNNTPVAPVNPVMDKYKDIGLLGKEQATLADQKNTNDVNFKGNQYLGVRDALVKAGKSPDSISDMENLYGYGGSNYVDRTKQNDGFMGSEYIKRVTGGDPKFQADYMKSSDPGNPESAKVLDAAKIAKDKKGFTDRMMGIISTSSGQDSPVRDYVRQYLNGDWNAWNALAKQTVDRWANGEVPVEAASDTGKPVPEKTDVYGNISKSIAALSESIKDPYVSPISVSEGTGYSPEDVSSSVQKSVSKEQKQKDYLVKIKGLINTDKTILSNKDKFGAIEQLYNKIMDNPDDPSIDATIKQLWKVTPVSIGAVIPALQNKYAYPKKSPTGQD